MKRVTFAEPSDSSDDAKMDAEEERMRHMNEEMDKLKEELRIKLEEASD